SRSVSLHDALPICRTPFGSDFRCGRVPDCRRCRAPDHQTDCRGGCLMELITIILSGILIGASVYLMLSKSLIRIIIGTALLSHGVPRGTLTIAQPQRGTVPVPEPEGSPCTAPPPRAMILTAIVIAFALTAYSLVRALRMYKEIGTDNVEEMKGVPRDD